MKNYIKRDPQVKIVFAIDSIAQIFHQDVGKYYLDELYIYINSIIHNPHSNTTLLHKLQFISYFSFIYLALCFEMELIVL